LLDVDVGVIEAETPLSLKLVLVVVWFDVKLVDNI
jgi:hypothetical protein